MWKSHCNNKEETHDSFKAAFKRIWDYINSTESLSYQELETWIWIIAPNFPFPMMFYDLRDKAYNEGLLTEDGQLVAEKFQ